MPVNEIATDAKTLADPAQDGAAVTPSDSTVFPATRKIYVGTAGDLAVKFAGGNTLTLPAVPKGFHDLCVVKVLQTGTTASGIVALY